MDISFLVDDLGDDDHKKVTLIAGDIIVGIIVLNRVELFDLASQLRYTADLLVRGRG